jgi:hypothetical protein
LRGGHKGKKIKYQKRIGSAPRVGLHIANPFFIFIFNFLFFIYFIFFIFFYFILFYFILFFLSLENFKFLAYEIGGSQDA